MRVRTANRRTREIRVTLAFALKDGESFFRNASSPRRHRPTSSLQGDSPAVPGCRNSQTVCRVPFQTMIDFRHKTYMRHFISSVTHLRLAAMLGSGKKNIRARRPGLRKTASKLSLDRGAGIPKLSQKSRSEVNRATISAAPRVLRQSRLACRRARCPSHWTLL